MRPMPAGSAPGIPSPQSCPSNRRSYWRLVDTGHAWTRALDEAPCCERDLNLI